MKPARGSKYLRKGRASIEGQYYLITTRTHQRQKFFSLPGTAEIVLDSLFWLEQKKFIDLEVAVVMPDHLHFVACLLAGTLSSLMHSLKSFTAKKIKTRLHSQGQIWQSQYHDHAIRKDEVLMDVIMYCLNNPVRAELVKDFHHYPYWYCRYEV
jgi:REP element-mobilizing transposase RayT